MNAVGAGFRGTSLLGYKTLDDRNFNDPDRRALYYSRKGRERGRVYLLL